MTTEATARPPEAASGAAAGLDGDTLNQLVTFTVAEGQFGIDIMAVREIRVWCETTPLPNVPDYVRGVVNLRGTIVPIVDLRARFRQGDTTPTNSHVVIVVAIDTRMVGILVDGVSDILSISPDQVKDVPATHGNAEMSFLDGLITVDEQMVGRIALDRLIDLKPLH